MKGKSYGEKMTPPSTWKEGTGRVVESKLNAGGDLNWRGTQKKSAGKTKKGGYDNM